MSTAKKAPRKRKHPSPTPIMSKVGRRLEKLRGAHTDLWADDDDDDDDLQPCVQSKTTTTNKTYIVLSDSDDEKLESRRRAKTGKSRKKMSDLCHEYISPDYETKTTPPCVTCLICSILTTLTSYNCCSAHLSLLVNSKNAPKPANHIDQWPPQQVMIVPMTDELLQRYLNPQQIHRLKTKTNASSNKKKPVERLVSTRLDSGQSNIIQAKTSTKSSIGDFDLSDQTSISPIVTESPVPPHSEAMPADTTFTVITSSSTTTNSFESPTVLDTCQIQLSSDQPICIEDSQPDHQQAKKSNDPWTPISDETYAAMEVALDRIEQTPDEQTEFTPATARRTPTELMASCLPKIRLRQGRYRQGKPTADKSSSGVANDCCVLSTSPSPSPSSSSTSISVVITNTRATPSSLATIIEDESLATPSNCSMSNKSSHVLSERHENLTEGLSDTAMSCLLAQDEASQQDYTPSIVKTPTNEVLPPPAIVIDDYSRQSATNQSVDISQSSQLSNDQSDTQQNIASASLEKTTPVRISYRTNPDGSRVSISRPSLTPCHPSPLISLHRILADAPSTTHHTNK